MASGRMEQIHKKKGPLEKGGQLGNLVIDVYVFFSTLSILDKLSLFGGEGDIVGWE